VGRNAQLDLETHMHTARIVTTSWDDGDQRDVRLAELLRSRKISGTFYIPIQPYRKPALSPAQLRDLALEGFEIGAHTVSHKHLWKLSEKELAEEINPCKPLLEDILGSEVRMFCYPRGRYDSRAIRAVKQAGYAGARTVRLLATDLQFRPFEMPTTVQAATTSRRSYFKNAVRARSLDSLQVCFAEMEKLGDWLELSKRLFDAVLERGGIWHLWGHSWEIDELGLWNDLEKLLDYVSQRDSITYLSNGNLIPCAMPHIASSSTHQVNTGSL
jgi:peptidoglycan-N-acetylglucosamine deacetylase